MGKITTTEATTTVHNLLRGLSATHKIQSEVEQIVNLVRTSAESCERSEITHEFDSEQFHWKVEVRRTARVGHISVKIICYSKPLRRDVIRANDNSFWTADLDVTETVFEIQKIHHELPRFVAEMIQLFPQLPQKWEPFTSAIEVKLFGA